MIAGSAERPGWLIDRASEIRTLADLAELLRHLRRAKGQAQMIPGWPYSFVTALEFGRTSWTAVLDAVRLGPADDATARGLKPHNGVLHDSMGLTRPASGL